MKSEDRALLDAYYESLYNRKPLTQEEFLDRYKGIHFANKDPWYWATLAVRDCEENSPIVRKAWNFLNAEEELIELLYEIGFTAAPSGDE